MAPFPDCWGDGSSLCWGGLEAWHVGGLTERPRLQRPLPRPDRTPVGSDWRPPFASRTPAGRQRPPARLPPGSRRGLRCQRLRGAGADARTSWSPWAGRVGGHAGLLVLPWECAGRGRGGRARRPPAPPPAVTWGRERQVPGRCPRRRLVGARRRG